MRCRIQEKLPKSANLKLLLHIFQRNAQFFGSAGLRCVRIWQGVTGNAIELRKKSPANGDLRWILFCIDSGQVGPHESQKGGQIRCVLTDFMFAGALKQSRHVCVAPK